MTRRPWTTAETDALCEMAIGGYSDREIAAELRRTQLSIKGRRYTLGLDTAIAQGRPRVHCRRTIGALVDAGVGPVEIAARLGMPVWTARRIAREVAR